LRALNTSEENVNESEKSKEKEQCTYPECGKLFKDLKAHMLTHQNERPHKCSIQTCAYHIKGFAKKHDKNRHTLIHQNIGRPGRREEDEGRSTNPNDQTPLHSDKHALEYNDGQNAERFGYNVQPQSSLQLQPRSYPQHNLALEVSRGCELAMNWLQAPSIMQTTSSPFANPGEDWSEADVGKAPREDIHLLDSLPPPWVGSELQHQERENAQQSQCTPPMENDPVFSSSASQEIARDRNRASQYQYQSAYSQNCSDSQFRNDEDMLDSLSSKGFGNRHSETFESEAASVSRQSITTGDNVACEWENCTEIVPNTSALFVSCQRLLLSK
jgi:hypothetical protein